MRESLSPASLGFGRGDRRRLLCALGRAKKVQVFRRIQAVLLVAQGQSFARVAQTVGLNRRTIYRLVHRYLARHQTADLEDRPRSGRPTAARGLTRSQILQALQRSPL